MKQDEVIILGIDPGYAITGFGIIIKKKQQLMVVNYGCITTGPDMPFQNRLKQVHQDLKLILKKYKPDCVAIESLFFCNNQKTAINVGQSRGVVVLTSILKNLPIYEYTPLQVKQATACYGRASKKQIQEMVKVILNLNEIPKPDDAADALAVAICCANSLDSQLQKN